MIEALRPYIDIGAVLFPLPAGQKIPTGIITNWQTEASSDPAQIAHWAAANPGCNWAMCAAASGFIVVDIDTKKIGREAAWQEWHTICVSWGIETINPTVQTPSGGWHIYARVPAGVDRTALKQPALKPGVIDIRANGFVLIPPSQINGNPYAAYL